MVGRLAFCRAWLKYIMRLGLGPPLVRSTAGARNQKFDLSKIISRFASPLQSYLSAIPFPVYPFHWMLGSGPTLGLPASQKRKIEIVCISFSQDREIRKKGGNMFLWCTETSLADLLLFPYFVLIHTNILRLYASNLFLDAKYIYKQNACKN